MPPDRTDLQKSAARANGAKSHGPITPRGKQTSSRNAVIHGFLAQSLVLPGESRDRFNQLTNALIAEFRPETTVEHMHVQRMIAAQWRLMRVWTYENAGMLQESAALSEPGSAVTEAGVWHNPAARDAAAFQALHGQARAGSIIQLSEMRYSRQFAQAVAQLHQHRKNKQTNPGNL